MKLVTLENDYIKQPLMQSLNDPTSVTTNYQGWSLPNWNPNILDSDNTIYLGPYNEDTYNNKLKSPASLGSLNKPTPPDTDISKYPQIRADANAGLSKKAINKMKLQKAMGNIGQGADIVSSILPNLSTYSGNYGGLAQGIDQFYDNAADKVMQVNPLVGGIMKTAGAVNKGLNALGVGTDGQTATDAILGSSPLGLTPVGLANSIFGSKTHSFYRDANALANVGGSYGSSNAAIEDAQSKANKKYGLFSGGARRKANSLIDEAQRQMNAISAISNKAEMVKAIDGMANYNLYQLNQNGGPQATYVASKGTKLRIKNICNKIYKKLKGGTITPKPFEPIIVLSEVIKFQNGGKSKNRTLSELISFAKEQNPRFIQRMSEPLRYVELPDGSKATHKMGWATAEFTGKEKPFIYSEIQEDDNGDLKDFGKDAVKRALDKKDILIVNTPEEAELFTNSNDLDHGYKSGWKDFFMPFYKDGGTTIQITVIKESTKEEPKEDLQKNVIPEGALHARKHNIENTDSLTQKGIPVINIEGEQQAEIERDEVILNLKLTNKLEELQKEYEKANKTEQNKIAIEAGKILVNELLHNTIDNTGLIDKCQKGGKINGTE